MDWAIGILGLLGSWYTGSGKRFGWLLWCAATVLMIYVSYKHGLIGITCTYIVYLLIEIRGWWLHDAKNRID